MKNLFLALGLFTIILWTSCGDGNVVIPTDPTIQAAEDSATIINHLADLGLSGEASRTETGVYYVPLTEGNGETIDESDIVTFNYTGKLLNDTIFDTTIGKIADSIRMAIQNDTVGIEATNIHLSLLNTFAETRNFEPFVFTYSGSGWTIDGQFISGFKDGISASFKNMKVGGTVLILIPSGEAYGTSGTGGLIEPNTVITFELSPIEVIKQP